MVFTNLVIIDPGWRNLGVAILCFDDLEKKIRKFSSTIDLKLYKQDVSIPHIIQKLDSEIFSLFPTSFFDYLVIEKQAAVFKKNAKLEMVIESFILSRNIKCRLVPLSAVTIKNKLGLEFGNGNHHKHKKDMVQWASENYKVTVDDHQADCIGLLHVFLEGQRRIKKKYDEYKMESFFHLRPFSKTMSLIAQPKIHEIKPGFSNACLFIDMSNGCLRKCHNPNCKETNIPASFITTREKKTPMFIFECFSCPFKFSCFPTKKQLFTLEANLKKARIDLGYHLKSNRYIVDLSTEEFKEVDIELINQYKLALKRFNMDLVDDSEYDDVTEIVCTEEELAGATKKMQRKIQRATGLDEDRWLMIQAYLTRLESKMDALGEMVVGPPKEPVEITLTEQFTSDEVLEEADTQPKKKRKFPIPNNYDTTLFD